MPFDAGLRHPIPVGTQAHETDLGVLVLHALGALRGMEGRAFREHLEECPLCTDRVRCIRIVAEVFGVAPDSGAPPTEGERRWISALYEGGGRAPGLPPARH